jgi:hypothetical protein
MYYAAYKDLSAKGKLKSEWGYGRLIREQLEEYYSLDTVRKMFSKISMKSVLKNERSYTYLKNALKAMETTYAERARSYLEDVYGITRGLTTMVTYGRRVFSKHKFGFNVNPKFDLQSLLPSKILLYNHIRDSERLEGGFPFDEENNVRISGFAEQLGIKELNMPTNYVNNFVQKARIKVTIISDPAVAYQLAQFEVDKHLMLRLAYN